MRARIRPEMIRHHAEETQCDHCGAPLYVGDRAFYDLDRGAVYCSKGCAADDIIPATLRFPALLDRAA